MGTHGHRFFVETDTAFTTRTGANPAPAVNPGGLTYTPGIIAENRLVTMAPEPEDHNRASDMILAAHSDTGYNYMSEARSRAGGLFFLTNNEDIPPLNGSILNIAQIIKAVMSSGEEAELGVLLIYTKEAVHIRNILEEMGHPQLPTPIQTDNSTANGVVNNIIQPKK